MPSDHDKIRIEKYRAGADEALELAREAATRARQDLAEGKIRDPGKLAMNAAIASGTMLDKARILNGDPTEITEHRDPRIAASLLAKRLGIVVDSTAVDLPVTAELPPAEAHGPERATSNTRARARTDGSA